MIVDNRANKKILIVDDEKKIREMIRMVLSSRGYEVCEASNGVEAFEKVKADLPDLVIMDAMMPIMNGFESCKKIREESDCPIIMLSAKGEAYDQVNGLESGADDYMIKPFTPMVLVAKIEAMLRRANFKETATISSGPLSIDKNSREVFINNDAVNLNRKEFELLYYLINNPKISLSRDQILEFVWGYDYLGSDNTVDTHVNRLRKKMGPYSGYIKTIRGYGYRFEVDDD
jgi:two-component system response regulator ResD